MRFQEGDYVLWEGEIERVVSVASSKKDQLAVITWYDGTSRMVMGSTLAKHQVPWYKWRSSNWKLLSLAQPSFR